MAERILSTAVVILLALALAGCPDSTSDEFAEDIQPLGSPIQNRNPDVYAGRVMNGELENAIVWLDREQTGKLDPDDPWTRTDEQGRFELDVTGLQRDPGESPDEDPRESPLMVVAVPDSTFDHRRGQRVTEAFFLMAPPGKTLITPFTTMVETWRRLSDIEDRDEAIEKGGTNARDRMKGTHESVSVFQDYLRSGAERTPFYARALTRLIAAQIPENISGGITDDSNPPDVDAFSLDDLQVIGSVLLDQVGLVLAEVDELIDAQGIDGFSLPADMQSIVNFQPDLTDPLLLREQVLFLPKEDQGDDYRFDAQNAAVEGRRSAIATYDYDVSSALRRVDFHGYAAPSMETMARLRNVGDRIRELGRQDGLDFDLNDPFEEAVSTGDDVIERFLFETTNSDVELFSARLSEEMASLDDIDTPTRVYRFEDSPVTRLTRVIPQEGNDVELALDLAYHEGGIGQIDLSDNGLVEVREFGEVNQCDGFSADDEQVINAEIQVDIFADSAKTEKIGQENWFGHYRGDELEDPIPAFRVLMRQYVPEDQDGTEGNRRWEYEYGDALDEDQPDLMRSLRIVDNAEAYELVNLCDNDDPDWELENDRELDAFISFDYLRFTDYLEQIGTRD